MPKAYAETNRGGCGVIHPYALAALIAAPVIFSAGWQTNQWKNDADKKQAVEQAAAQQRELHAMEQKRSSNVIAAQNLARTREIGLRRDADSARNALDSLRDKSAAALLSARTSHDACLIAANAQAVIQSQCATELTTLGGIADRHTSDIETLVGAWPK